MGQKAANEGALMFLDALYSPWDNIHCAATVASGAYSLEFTASGDATVCNAMNVLNSGDLIAIDGKTAGHFFHVDEVNGSKITILPSQVQAKHGLLNCSGLLFLS